MQTKRLGLIVFMVVLLAVAKCQEEIEKIKEQNSDFEDLVFKKYQKFMAQYNKTYETPEEMNRRFEIFRKNYLQAKLEEEKYDHTLDEGKHFGTTEFMDLDPEEFSRTYLSLNATELPSDTEQFFNGTEEDSGRFLEETEEIPESWDWTKKGALNPVRAQGYCGSCWAFATISNIESMYFLKYGKLPKLSEQQLVDCDPYNSGCVGGIMHNAYYYIMLYGIQKQESYPYEFNRGTCRYDYGENKLTIKGYKSAGTIDEEKIKEFLYKNGPLAITMNGRLLQYYRGGVLNVAYDYCPYAPNHGVNLVGYGVTQAGLKYWIVRNTWGPYWGEGGYFRIARGVGLCGVNRYVVSAVLK